MLDTPCSEVVWRVLATHSLRHFPLHFPSRASLCAITFQLDSTTADAHISASSSRRNWSPRRFKWTRPFRRKTKSGFCACAITFQTQSTHFQWPQHMNFKPNITYIVNNTLRWNRSIVVKFTLFQAHKISRHLGPFDPRQKLHTTYRDNPLCVLMYPPCKNVLQVKNRWLKCGNV